MNAASLENQIDTTQDAVDFLTGQWSSKPAEVGFAYSHADLAGYARAHLIGMARDVAKEIDAQRQEQRL